MAIALYQKAKKQELLSKHAKFFAAGKSDTRTQLQGIRYVEDGTAYVTDGHVLLRIRDVSPFAEAHTLHAITGAELEGEFFSQQAMDNLFRWDPENRILLDGKEQIEETTRYAKIAQIIEKEMKASVKMVDLVLAGERAFLGVSDLLGINFKAPIPNPEKEQTEEWTFNADYLYNALNLFKNAGTKSLAIKLRHRYGAVTFSDEENGIDVLILPIRTSR